MCLRWQTLEERTDALSRSRRSRWAEELCEWHPKRLRDGGNRGQPGIAVLVSSVDNSYSTVSADEMRLSLARVVSLAQFRQVHTAEPQTQVPGVCIGVCTGGKTKNAG